MSIERRKASLMEEISQPQNAKNIFMKKAKIILTTLGILTIISGAVGYKAKTITTAVYTGPAVGAVCNITLAPATLKVIPAPSDPRTFATLIPGAPCIQTVTTFSL